MTNEINYVEASLLGTFAKFKYLMHDTKLKEQHFTGINKMIFNAMKESIDNGESADYYTLITKYTDLMQHTQYLVMCQDRANEEKFDEYEQTTINIWRESERKNILNRAWTEDWESERVVQELSNLFKDEMSDYHDIRELVMDMMNAPFEEPKEKKYASTGLINLNLMLGGFEGSKLYVVAGRPGMGKTDFIINSLLASAQETDYLPIMFSLEMKAKGELMGRVAANIGGFNRNYLRQMHTLPDNIKNNWGSIMQKATDTGIKIFDKPRQSMSEIRRKVRQVQKMNPDKKIIVFIDYLGLMGNDKKHSRRDLEIEENTNESKNLAKEFDCPVILLAQLNREVEKRPDKRPMISDLKDSGSIEQDADAIIFLYRDGYYTKDESNRTLELIIAKQRAGQTGTILAEYNSSSGRIINKV